MASNLLDTSAEHIFVYMNTTEMLALANLITKRAYQFASASPLTKLVLTWDDEDHNDAKAIILNLMDDAPYFSVDQTELIVELLGDEGGLPDVATRMYQARNRFLDNWHAAQETLTHA